MIIFCKCAYYYILRSAKVPRRINQDSLSRLKIKPAITREVTSTDSKIKIQITAVKGAAKLSFPSNIHLSRFNFRFGAETLAETRLESQKQDERTICTFCSCSLLKRKKKENGDLGSQAMLVEFYRGSNIASKKT